MIAMIDSRRQQLWLVCMILLQFNLIIATTSHRPYTPSEWAARFRCEHHQNGSHSEAAVDITEGQCGRQQALNGGPNKHCDKEEDVCSRHQADWMWKYVDEMTPEFRVLINERSIDERLANIIYTTVTTRELDPDLQRINLRDPEMQRHFEQSMVVGPQVNYSLCGLQLAEMLRLGQELSGRLEEARTGHLDLTSLKLNESHIRLARVLDSNGRYQSGSLSSKFIMPGSYDQCINSQLLLATAGAGAGHNQGPTLVGMRSCMAGVSLAGRASVELQTRKRFDFERGALDMQVFICLPETCHSKSLHHHRQLIQQWLDIEFKFPQTIYLHETATLNTLSCLVDHQSPMTLPRSGRLFLVCAAAWMLLIAYATCRTVWPAGWRTNRTRRLVLVPGQGGRRTWIQCMSLIDNWKDLMEIRDEKDHQQQLQHQLHNIDLDVLNPIKVLACCGATFVHAFMSLHIGSNTLLRDHKLMESDPIMAVVIGSPLMVETYFVLSGVLTSYLALKKVDKYEEAKRRLHLQPDEEETIMLATCKVQKQLNPTNTSTDHQSSSSPNNVTNPSQSRSRWIVNYSRETIFFLQKCLVLVAARYLRLLPLIYLFFWFKKSVFQYVGSGPFFNYGLNKDSGGQCHNESWWSLLSLSSVYDPIFKKCLPQSYTVSSDLIFMILIAPIIFLINKFPRTVVAGCLLISLWSSWAGLMGFLNASKQLTWNMADIRIFGLLRLLSTPLVHLYISPEYRLFSVIFGVLVGWLVYRYDHHMAKQKQLTVLKSTNNNDDDGDDDDDDDDDDDCPIDYWRPKWAMNVATIWALLFPLSVAISAAHHAQLRSLIYPHHRTIFPYVYMAGKVLWALASAIICLRLLTDWGTYRLSPQQEERQAPLVRWSKLRIWRILAKLNYAILLIHLDLLFLDWQLQTNETMITRFKLFTTQAYAHTSSIVLGILVFVLVENPIDKLVKLYIIR